MKEKNIYYVVFRDKSGSWNYSPYSGTIQKKAEELARARHQIQIVFSPLWNIASEDEAKRITQANREREI